MPAYLQGQLDPKRKQEKYSLLTRLANATGAEAKKIGRTIPMSHADIKEWDDNSSRIMKALIKESFEQNPDALAKLLATGNATLTHTQDKGKWGTEFPKLLMEVSDELRGTQPTVQPVGEVKEGVSELFESNPELANIGTPEQYSQYLNTIFPESKVKDIVYHWSVGSQISEQFGDDLGRVKGVWISKDPNQWKDIIKNKRYRKYRFLRSRAVRSPPWTARMTASDGRKRFDTWMKGERHMNQATASKAPYVVEWRDGFLINIAQVDREHKHLFALVKRLEIAIARLRTVARETATPLAPVDSLFESHSPDRLIGRELVLEHLHPNIRGYSLMAEAFEQSMRSSGLVFGRDAWDKAPVVTQADALLNSTVSRFDTLMGAIKIGLLTHRWPFVQQTASFVYRPKDAVEQIVYRYVQGQSAWSEARYELSEQYAREGRFDDARRECRAVAAVIPHAYQPYLRIAHPCSQAETTFVG